MKKILLVLFIVLAIGCAKPPLAVSLTSSNSTYYIHSDGNFICNAAGGSGEYVYNWELDNKKIDYCSGNSCAVSFDALGAYNINCEVSDGKETANKSVSVEVVKIPKKIECIFGFGDSLTAGYGVKPEDSWISLYSKNFEDIHLFNYAVSGATSYNVSYDELMMLNVNDYYCFGNSLVFLWFGANDIINFISVEDFRNNYIKVIDSLSSEKREIILITIPDVSKLNVANDIQQSVNNFLSVFGIQIDVKKISQDVVSQYNEIIFELAKQYNLNVIDMFTYMNDFDNSMVGKDRFHPNEKGHKEISNIVSKEVDGFFKDYRLY